MATGSPFSGRLDTFDRGTHHDHMMPDVLLLFNPRSTSKVSDGLTVAGRWLRSAEHAGLRPVMVDPSALRLRDTSSGTEIIGPDDAAFCPDPDIPLLVLQPPWRYPRIVTTVAGRQRRCMNTLAALSDYSKLVNESRFAAAGLPRPDSEVVGSPEAAVRAAEERLGWPLVLKSGRGGRGEAVWLAHDLASAEAIWNDVREYSLLAQRFIEVGGRDRRLLVVGGEVVAAGERQAHAGEWRANLGQGGEMRVVEPTAAECDLALAAMRAVGFDWGGVDVIAGPDGPLLLEVNAVPSVVGISEATGRDLGAVVLRHLVGHAA
jgi:RimK family alpha-L-glutamate ligase